MNLPRLFSNHSLLLCIVCKIYFLVFEIFRKIFGTELYLKIQTAAKERARRIETASAQLRRDRLGRIRAFATKDEALLGLIAAAEPDIARILECFTASIEADKLEEKSLAVRYGEADAAIEKLSKEIALAEGNNRKLEDLVRSRKELGELTAQIARLAGAAYAESIRAKYDD